MTAPRVVIVQPYVPDYRIPLFTDLRRALAHHGISLVIAAAQAQNQRHDDQPLANTVLLHDRMAFSRGRFRYRSLSTLEMRPDDRLIIEDAMKNLESWPLLLSRSRRSVALWGHGAASAHGRSSLPRLKDWFRRRADWYFAYTPSAAHTVRAAGFPSTRVTTLHNTLDTQSLRDDLASVSAEVLGAFRAAHQLTPGRTALFLGSIDDSRDIAFLETVIDTAYRRDGAFRLIVAGRGSAEDRILHRPGVVALGRARGAAKATALAASDAIVMPQGIGLVAVDSLVSGVPIVTRDGAGHGPEASYLTPDTDSLWMPGDCSAQDFADALLDLLTDSVRIDLLSEGCQRKSSSFELRNFVDDFSSGIRDWIAASASR